MILFSRMISCKYCGQECIKKGWQCLREKLFCKFCRKYQQLTYSFRKINSEHRRVIIFLNNEGCSISTIYRFIEFSKTTVCKIISTLGQCNFLSPEQFKIAKYLKARFYIWLFYFRSNKVQDQPMKESGCNASNTSKQIIRKEK